PPRQEVYPGVSCLLSVIRSGFSHIPSAPSSCTKTPKKLRDPPAAPRRFYRRSAGTVNLPGSSRLPGRAATGRRSDREESPDLPGLKRRRADQRGPAGGNRRRHTETLGHRDTGTPRHRDNETPRHWDTGTTGHRDTDLTLRQM
ncbi:Hypothetical predicted protein, partial [Scomber scombrus]